MSKKILSVLITGAGGGIGCELAAQLSKEYRVILTDKNKHGLEKCATSLKLKRVPLVVGDLGDINTIENIKSLTNTMGGLYGIVSNAGEYPRIPFNKLTIDDIRKSFENNFFSHAELALAFREELLAGTLQRLVFISSIQTVLPRVELTHYITAKSALEGLVHTLAIELGSFGCTVNTIRPGSIKVPMEQKITSDIEAMETRQLLRQAIKRRGTSSDVAAAARFLLSQDASFISGQSLNVDGGWSTS